MDGGLLQLPSSKYRNMNGKKILCKLIHTACNKHVKHRINMHVNTLTWTIWPKSGINYMHCSILCSLHMWHYQILSLLVLLGWIPGLIQFGALLYKVKIINISSEMSGTPTPFVLMNTHKMIIIKHQPDTC